MRAGVPVGAAGLGAAGAAAAASKGASTGTDSEDSGAVKPKVWPAGYGAKGGYSSADSSTMSAGTGKSAASSALSGKSGGTTDSTGSLPMARPLAGPRPSRSNLSAFGVRRHAPRLCSGLPCHSTCSTASRAVHACERRCRFAARSLLFTACPREPAETHAR
jgi:hypothetical protein